MKVTLGGKFEIPLLRDIVADPDRERLDFISSFQKFLFGHRKVDEGYFHRSGTFLVVSDGIGLLDNRKDIPHDDDEWGPKWISDFNLRAHAVENKLVANFVDRVLVENALSVDSLRYVSQISFAQYGEEFREGLETDRENQERNAAEYYLSRLLRQLYAARMSREYLVLSEHDFCVVREIVEWAKRNPSELHPVLPDFSPEIIIAEKFALGLLNFAPPDLQAVSAVRSDRGIRRYAKKIGSILEETPSEQREEKMLRAMVEAHDKSEAGRKAKKVFEVVTCVLKPIKWTVGVDIPSVIEDAKDFGEKAVSKIVEGREFHLLCVRMQDIAVKDYLERKK